MRRLPTQIKHRTTSARGEGEAVLREVFNVEKSGLVGSLARPFDKTIVHESVQDLPYILNEVREEEGGSGGRERDERIMEKETAEKEVQMKITSSCRGTLLTLFSTMCAKTSSADANSGEVRSQNYENERGGKWNSQVARGREVVWCEVGGERRKEEGKE